MFAGVAIILIGLKLKYSAVAILGGCVCITKAFKFIQNFLDWLLNDTGRD